MNGKRITFKRTRPNPLFQDWLEELHEEAQQKQSKLEPMLKEALSSLSKYPLPLQSGAECAILKGFDKRLCLFLDKRLEVYKSCNEEYVDEDSGDETNFKSHTAGHMSSENGKSSNIISNMSPERNNSPSTNLNSPPNKKKITIFMPALMSGSYALLMALLHLKEEKVITKSELTTAAQKYCDKDITNEWKDMTGLIKRGLVTERMYKLNTTHFCLTDEGLLIAKDLSKKFEKNHVENVNDLLFDENKHTSEIINIDDNEAKPCTNVLQHDGSQYNSEVIIVNDTEDKSKNVDTFNNYNKTPINVTSNLMHDTSTISGAIEIIEHDIDLIEMEPGTYDIILLIDKNETSGLTKKNDPTITQFNNYPELKHEYRSLKVGDFTWIARHKLNNAQELVLPYVVERKRIDDLSNSIKDGRYHEQKFRLRKCGLNHVIYMVENHGNNKHVGLPMQSLMQALANTRVQDKFKVHITESLADSVKFLNTMTLRLIYEYKDKKLKGHNKQSQEDILMTFSYFNKSCVKNRPLTVTDTFIKLLLQLKGMSVRKALAITNVYKTPRSLIEKYKNCDTQQGEMLLAKLKLNEKNCSVGLCASKTVYQLFTFRNV